MMPAPSPKPTPRRRALICATATIVSLLALAATAQAAVPRSFFGLSAVQPTAADFEGMGDIGAGSFRVEIPWPAVQGSKDGPFAWAGIDQRISLAATQGLRPVPIIFGTPAFISGDSKHVRGPVKGEMQRAEWEQFTAAAVARYGPGGDFWAENPSLSPGLAPGNWILWNEQNAPAFWHPKANPSQYATLLRITREAVDTIDPSIELTVGGMYGFPQNPKGMTSKKFLKQLYKKRGIKKLIDGVSAHPYAGNLAGVSAQVKDLRRVMDRAGDRKADLYIGEIGWASGGPKRSSLVKSQAGQARLLKQAYDLFLSRRRQWNIEAVYWFTWRDYAGAGPDCAWCPKAGLLSKKNKRKPAGRAFEKLVDKKVG